MKITNTLLLAALLLFVNSCIDPEKKCKKHQFSSEERTYFNYTIGEKVKFVSDQCDDTLVIEISNRSIDEGARGKYPEADEGKCYSFLKVSGKTKNSNPLNCFNINGTIFFEFRKFTGDNDMVELQMDSGSWNTKDANATLGNTVIRGKTYSSVILLDNNNTTDQAFKSIYLTLRDGLLKIDYRNGADVISYEKIY